MRFVWLDDKQHIPETLFCRNDGRSDCPSGNARLDVGRRLVRYVVLLVRIAGPLVPYESGSFIDLRLSDVRQCIHRSEKIGERNARENLSPVSQIHRIFTRVDADDERGMLGRLRAP